MSHWLIVRPSPSSGFSVEVGGRIGGHETGKVVGRPARDCTRGGRRRAGAAADIVASMHPIERLRYVARASGADQGLLVQETAGALASLGIDPAGMVTACRRIVDRHVTSGPLWWLCARVLLSNDAVTEAWRCADEIGADTTGDELAYALPDDATVCVLGWPELAGDALVRRGDCYGLVVDTLGEGSGLVRRLRRADAVAEEVPPSGLGAAAAASDLVLLEASAIGPDGCLAVAGSRAAAAVARHAGVPVWLVGGVGRRPGRRRCGGALVRRFEEEGGERVGRGRRARPARPRRPPLRAGRSRAPADGLRRADTPVAPELFRPTAF